MRSISSSTQGASDTFTYDSTSGVGIDKLFSHQFVIVPAHAHRAQTARAKIDEFRTRNPHYKRRF
jgi:hypothetical protein